MFEVWEEGGEPAKVQTFSITPFINTNEEVGKGRMDGIVGSSVKSWEDTTPASTPPLSSPSCLLRRTWTDIGHTPSFVYRERETHRETLKEVLGRLTSGISTPSVVCNRRKLKKENCRHVGYRAGVEDDSNGVTTVLRVYPFEEKKEK